MKINLLCALLAACVPAVTGYTQVSIVPHPQVVKWESGYFSLSGRTAIVYDSGLQNEAAFLQAVLRNEHQVNAAFRIARPHEKQLPSVIRLSLANDLPDTLGREGYRLAVQPRQVRIAARSAAGVFYGIQSLRQMAVQKTRAKALAFPCASIEDKPRFSWRAFMLDEARYFKGTPVVKHLLDEMALMKMNTFHWHLTDDQGWRIEIKKYPLLTKTGAYRRESETGTWLSNVFDGTPHGGFYTQDEVKEIIQYAAGRHITIIPEVEMPGHAGAAIAAYPWLGVKNEPMEVTTRFGIQNEVFHIVKPEVLQFLHDVLDEIMALFPSPIVHIGGDEVQYGHWQESEEVNRYMREQAIHSAADLQIRFTNAISAYLAARNHRMMGWNDILGTENEQAGQPAPRQTLSRDAIIHFWTGDPTIVNEAVARGHDVVNSHSAFTYLDYDYATTSLEKTYSFEPIPKGLPPEQHEKILGLGCQMWGEWIPTVEKMNQQIFPRIAACAEVGWSHNRNISRFSAAWQNYLAPRWKRKGIALQY
jgi:hexosaminidase